jgi:hypothetical protein
MFTCRVCRFTVEMDDVTLLSPNGHCVCLGCYLRATDQWLAMPKTLHREVSAAVAEVAAAAEVRQTRSFGYGW